VSDIDPDHRSSDFDLRVEIEALMIAAGTTHNGVGMDEGVTGKAEKAGDGKEPSTREIAKAAGKNRQTVVEGAQTATEGAPTIIGNSAKDILDHKNAMATVLEAEQRVAVTARAVRDRAPTTIVTRKEPLWLTRAT